jgi:AcrR family transcriptional regulator
LESAERAIRRHGPTLSLDRIAAQAGVSKPVLFSHVGDRRELVRALAERLLGRIEQAVGTARTGGPGGRPALRRVIAAQLETIASDRHLYAFVNGAGAGDTTLATTLEFARRAATPLARDLRDALFRSGRDPSQAEPWSFAIIGMMHMVGLWWLAGETRSLDAAELADRLTELLWSGLAPPPSSPPSAPKEHRDGRRPGLPGLRPVRAGDPAEPLPVVRGAAARRTGL